MKLYQAPFLLLASLGISEAAAAAQVVVTKEEDAAAAVVFSRLDEYMNNLAMLGAPVSSTTNSVVGRPNRNNLKRDTVLRGTASGGSDRGKNNDSGQQRTLKKKGMKGGAKNCKDLDEFPQWSSEVGYWIGEYTLLQGDGTYNVNPNWPYPYDQYTGFITGNISGTSYRQRNVFLYPPQTSERCTELENASMITVSGDGTCGENGNSLVFAADQTGCSDDGSISGSFSIDFGGFSVPVDTTTELVGADNALLYQVSSSGVLTQSQLTTLLQNGSLRVRTAQSFSFTGEPGGTSYYRERKVTKEEFYTKLDEFIALYNIREEDLCYLNGFNRLPVDGYTPGAEQCRLHLEQSFMLEEDLM